MKNYVVYFAKNIDFIETAEFECEYSVTANSEDEARQKAIALFIDENPNLSISDYTVGFSNC